MRTPFLAFGCLFVCCCAGTGTSRVGADQGKEFLAREAYGEAEAWYRKRLETRPQDPGFQEGLARARTGWVQKALRRVRSLRLEGHWDEAFEGMKRVVRQARAWEMAVPTDTGPEYEEEVVALVRELDTRLQARWARPLAALRFLEAHREVFGDGFEGVRLWMERQDQVARAGAGHCEALWRLVSPRAPFFAEFTARYCAAFGVQKTLEPPIRLALAVGRFGVLTEGSLRLDGLEMPEREALLTAIADAFQATPWFAPTSTAQVRMEARGVLLATTRSEETPLEHPFVLHVPYTDLEEYCEWTQVPVTFPRWVDGRQVIVTENRSECQTRTREVAKVRTEPQVLRFQGRRVQQSFRLQIEASLHLGGMVFRAAISDHLNETDLAHDEERPDIGLHRDPLELTPRAEWLRGRFQQLSRDLGDRLREAWRTRWCLEPSPEALDLQAEAHLRCLAVPGEPPEAVVVWSQSLFGLGPDEILATLGWGRGNEGADGP